MNILSLLVERGVIRESEVAGIEAEATKDNRPVEDVLVTHGVSVDDILAAKGAHVNLPVTHLPEGNVPFETLRYIPEESALHYKIAPIAMVDGVLEVGIIDPDNLEAVDALNFISSRAGIPYKLFLISQSDYDRVLSMYKGISGEVSRALNELEGELSKEKGNADSEEGGGVSLTQKEADALQKEDAPVTKIVATLLKDAVEGRASDIHIEHVGDKVRVRFRVDGMLHTSIVLPPTVHRSVITRVKILSSMKLDERRKPQDGRFSATIEGRKVDFRVSTFPSYHGEKVVMRILDMDKKSASLESVGLSPSNLETIRRAVKRPYGLILISGPTGSGKSTTLYGMLSEVDRDHHNVVSLEDPIEYSIAGVNQSQVHPEIGYSFASGLRSILRQDPNVIMVGEIRDKETAQLAVQASLTGHLVFSTIHTNNALGVIPRLVDMGVDPYLIAPTLVLVIAQRLIRTLCPGGGKKIPITGALKMMLDKQFQDLPQEFHSRIPKSDYLYEIAPTPECPSGTRGRIGAFEMIEMNSELEQAILGKPDEQKIWNIVRSQGMLTMKEDAIIKALEGKIPFEEVNTLGGDMLVDEEAPSQTPRAEE